MYVSVQKEGRLPVQKVEGSESMGWRFSVPFQQEKSPKSFSKTIMKLSRGHEVFLLAEVTNMHRIVSSV